MPRKKELTIHLTINDDQIACLNKSLLLFIKSEQAMIDHYIRREPNLTSKSPVLLPYLTRIANAKEILTKIQKKQ